MSVPLHCPTCGAIVATVDTPRSVCVVPWDEPADVRVRCTAQLEDRVCGEKVAVRVVWRRASGATSRPDSCAVGIIA